MIAILVACVLTGYLVGSIFTVALLEWAHRRTPVVPATAAQLTSWREDWNWEDGLQHLLDDVKRDGEKSE